MALEIFLNRQSAHSLLCFNPLNLSNAGGDSGAGRAECGGKGKGPGAEDTLGRIGVPARLGVHTVTLGGDTNKGREGSGLSGEELQATISEANARPEAEKGEAVRFGSSRAERALRFMSVILAAEGTSPELLGRVSPPGKPC